MPGEVMRDKARFPDPKAMVDSIHAMHARMMISVWPKFYVTTEHFKEFDENGWMYQQSVKDSLKDWVGPGYHYGFYDAYDPDARKLFWKQMYEHYYPLGNFISTILSLFTRKLIANG